jgi:hypothetical protein
MLKKLPVLKERQGAAVGSREIEWSRVEQGRDVRWADSSHFTVHASQCTYVTTCHNMSQHVTTMSDAKGFSAA